MYVVYGLEDPRDNNVFYVGTTADIYARFIQHIRCEENNEAKNARIHELKASGLLPLPRTLEAIHTARQAGERELYWINHYACLGMPLTNEIRPAALRRLRETLGMKASSQASLMVELPISEDIQGVARQVIALHAEGIQKPEVMFQVWGVRPGANEAYRKAMLEYQQVMRFISAQIGV
jgi:hypothetical protein